ncbi:PREDICTED: piggyBac transposable element-derived protein 3-like [Amphimedon queenslandica]|uniref:PiggyBac transposable element-derived protein domain-containing protein n=1 Tax=Amphimedon queenslandica TaxID=400682 RepID=A0AAN0IUG6_AMPQE|nr:PREDICTED: piggyBac transposable element-derived protein 3-like [Amphimedon queenslandica]|eukprot:XP_011410264.1 PREDICTED: piggyBac transposable element-derived protein 3-like [Amphimedon queenslandica]
MGDSKYEKWEKFGASDLYAYFGIMILMGLVDLPYLYNYWSKDKIFCYPAIAEKMARDRFIDIHKYLHFTNNEAHGSDLDHLWKVREVLSMIKRFCLYNQNRECPIDKVMVPYKGNSSLKQYMPKKPVRRGLKVSVRAYSHKRCVSIPSVCKQGNITIEGSWGESSERSFSQPCTQAPSLIL